MDPRKILGVGNDATQEEIHKAFRAKAKKHHPDLGGDTWAFQQVQEAYHALTDSEFQTDVPSSLPKQAAQAAATAPNPKSVSGTLNRPSNVKRKKKTPSQTKSSKVKPKNLSGWLTGELPLQNETTYFILVNCLDIFFTYILLRFGAMEANPIANYFMQQWGFNGMIAFKLVIVAVVCVISQVVALEKLSSARALLIIGTTLVALVNIYSLSLFAKNYL